MKRQRGRGAYVEKGRKQTGIVTNRREINKRQGGEGKTEEAEAKKG